MKKETLYIDVEDDITAVIEKISDIKEKIIALVPPKRSGVLSSVVNLKLVNKSAHDASKRVVLITTDKTLVSLAGGVGMYVAPNLQSAPAIPAVSVPPEDMPSEIISESATETSVGEKAASRHTVEPEGRAERSHSAKVKDDPPGDPKPAAAPGKKKLKIPDFGLFKKRMLLVVLGVILLIAGWIWAFYLAPSAHVSLEGQTNRIATDVNFVADTSLQGANFDKKELPATSKELKKDQSESFTPTGEKNNGKKATGTMALKNCEHHNGGTSLPAGTTVSAGGLNFATDTAVALPESSFSGGGNCNTPTKSVSVTAQESGDQYNLSARNYIVSGHPDIGASGSAMAGGTNDIVKVVSQADVDKAKDAALAKIREGSEDSLRSQFPGDVYILGPSYSETVTEVTSSVPVGERADTASVSVSATYFALGVNKDVLTEFLKSSQKSTLQTNQAIFNTGLDSANVTKLEAPSASRQKFNLKTDAFAGPDVNIDELRKALAGKGFGESKRALESLPGVTKADIDLSPFWVFSMPHRASKIIIEIKVN